MGASQVKTLATARTAPTDDKIPLGELMDRLPIGSTLRPALLLQGGDEEPKRSWEVRHEKLSFWVVRDTPEEAIRAFIHAVDKRGLRPHLEGTTSVPNPQPLHEQNPVSKPAIV